MTGTISHPASHISQTPQEAVEIKVMSATEDVLLIYYDCCMITFVCVHVYVSEHVFFLNLSQFITN